MLRAFLALLLLVLSALSAAAQSASFTQLAVSPLEAQRRHDVTMFAAVSTNGIVPTGWVDFHSTLGGFLGSAPLVPLGPGQGHLESGTDHTCTITPTGGVQCWGWNGVWQLGDGTQTDHWSPVDVLNLPGPVIQIAAGSQHTCALTEAGAVWCWGFNNAGQLGLGDDLDHTLPEAVIGLPVPIIQITAGQYHTCAIGTNRRIYCWGNNPYGQLGDGTQDQHFTPIRVGGLPQAVQVAAGWGHTCAIDVQTRVWCWGENLNGAFGNDTQDSSLVPVRSWMNDASFIAAGLQTTCAIKISNQGVYCWGRNWTGQVGDGSVTSRFHPVRVVGVRAIMVSMGRDHTCAATRAGGVACWGLNDHGQLGDGTTDNSSWAVGPHFPEAVGTWAVSAANYGSCAQSSGGEVWCWGDNAEGDTGDGTNDTPRLTPVATVGGAFAWPRATAFARLVTSTLPLGIQRSWAFYAGSDQVGGSQSRNVRHRVRR